MKASVYFTGIDEMRRRIFALPPKVGRRILAKGLRAGAKVVQKAMVDTMPVGPDKDGHTHLKDAVKVKAGKRSSIKVDYFCQVSSKEVHPTISKAGKRGWYPSAIEYGSHDAQGNVHIEGRGTMRKAFDTAGPKARDAILQIFADELEKAASTP